MTTEELMRVALVNQARFCADNNIQTDVYRDFDKHYSFYKKLGFDDHQATNMAYQKCEDSK